MASPSAESTAALREGLAGTSWDVAQLWVAAMGIGGEMRRQDVDDITEGVRAATAAEHDILATALNDWFCEHDQNHPVVLWRALAHS